MFEPQQILWMLKDKSIFEKMINLMKDRGYFSQQIWQYGFLHNDVKIVQEYLYSKKNQNPNSSKLNIFEYYPYYSMRSHKFLNENKTSIRNVEFKQTYFNYLFYSLIKNQQQSAFKLSFAYYLLLQDRIDEASKCFKMMS